MDGSSDLLGQLITTASQFQAQGQSQEAVDALKGGFEQLKTSPVYLESLGEALLENGELDQALEILQQGCQLDPQAEQGVEKFLYLGQIEGSSEGIRLLQTALERMWAQMKDVEAGTVKQDLEVLFAAYGDAQGVGSYLKKKLNQGIFAMVEIWMTDLCDAPEAEEQCEKLIGQSMEIDSENPETWTMLASVRISQQRNADAVQAISRAWELFAAKKQALENAAQSQDVENEYIELIDPLLTLAKYAMEMGMFAEAAEVSSSVQDINERSVESFYLEGFALYLNAKRIQNNVEDSHEVSQNYEKYPLQVVVPETDASHTSLVDSRRALTSAFKLLQIDSIEEQVDPELRKTIRSLLKELGGPLKGGE